MGHILRTFATLNSSIYSIKAKNPTHNFWAVYPFEWRRLIRFSSIFFFFLAGPSFWGLINPQWNMCNKGRRQSPIDVVPDKLLFDPYLRPLHIDKHKVRRGHEVMRCSTTSFHPPPLARPLTWPGCPGYPICIAGFRHSAQHGPVAGLPRGQGHQAAREHIRWTVGLPLPVRGDLHTLWHRECSRIRALHPGL